MYLVSPPPHASLWLVSWVVIYSVLRGFVQHSFGLRITPGLIKVLARIPVSQKVIYRGNKSASPRFGSWNMMDLKFNAGASVNSHT